MNDKPQKNLQLLFLLFIKKKKKLWVKIVKLILIEYFYINFII